MTHKKIKILALLSVLSISPAFAADKHKAKAKKADSAMTENVKELRFHTEKIGDAVHWMPEVTEVTPGEKVKLVFEHKLEGGFDFHGVMIPELKIMAQVNRNKPLEIEAIIPSDIKPGEYPISCQFHPKHVGAKLVVKNNSKQ